METAAYYRSYAAKARRLLAGITPGYTSEILEKLAQEYDELAAQLERGSVDSESTREMSRQGQGK
jgi:hypothetical protein